MFSARRTLANSILLLLLALFALPLSAASLAVRLTDQNGEEINDAVVYVSAVDGNHAAVVPQQVIVDQVDETFVPHVRATTIGSSVSFPNSDHIRHHVYSFSPTKSFELPLYIGIPAAPLTFDQAGLVTLGCNIHDHMLGYILVLETPWFAEVTAGSAVINGLPDGQMTVDIWHPRLVQDKSLQLTVATGTSTLQQQIEIRPERMVRRAPRRGSKRY